jgi:hypothetical protein
MAYVADKHKVDLGQGVAVRFLPRWSMLTEISRHIVVEIDVDLTTPILRTPILLFVIPISEIVPLASFPERKSTRILPGPRAAIRAPVQIPAVAVPVIGTGAQVASTYLVSHTLEPRKRGIVIPKF